MRIFRVVWLPTMALLLGLSFAGCGGGGISSQYGTDSFLPLATGNNWIYEVTRYNTTAPGGSILSIDAVTHAIGAPNGGTFPLHISSASGTTTAFTQHLKWDGSNLLKLSETYPSAVFSYQPPIILFKNGVGSGTEWVSSSTAVDSINGTTSTVSTTFETMGYESVTTAAGTFSAYKVKSYATTGGVYAYQLAWHAQGVGIVKMETYANSPLNGDSILAERYTLLGYTLAY